MATSRLVPDQLSQANNTRFKFISICIGLSMLVVLFCSLHATRDATSANRAFGMSLLVIFLLSLWILRYIETRRQLAAWQQISDRLGLNIYVRGFPFRMKTIMSGKYQGRMLWLYSTRCGKEWRTGTRVEIELHQPTAAILSLWGPYEFESISPSMIKSSVKRFGGKRLCFFKTNSPQVERYLVKSRLRQALLDLNYEVKIHLQDDLLICEQTDSIYQTDTLIQQINILSDLAHSIVQWPLAQQADPSQDSYLMA